MQSVTNPSHGTATINSDNTITYRPNLNFNGEDSFTYTISDGNGGTDTATVHITVSTVNDNPVVNDDTASTHSGQAVTIRVLDNDVDGDGDTLSVRTLSSTSDGTTRINSDNTINYTPGPNFRGIDFFVYVIDDGHGGIDVGIVDIFEVFG